MSQQTCQACGAVTATPEANTTHRYLESSPGCWAAYGQLLEREYSNAAYMGVHGLTVDAYAVQHPGVEGPQTISSINVHLASLLAYVEQGLAPHQLAPIKQQVVKLKPSFHWLTPPPARGQVTVVDVLTATSAEEHARMVDTWARAALAAWSDHHGTIEKLLAQVDGR